LNFAQGTFAINEGQTYQVGHGATAGRLSGAISNSGTLAFSRSDASTFDGVISGTGAVNTNGTLTVTGANTYSGITTIYGGTLIVSGSHGALGTSLIENDGHLVFNRSGTLAMSNVITGTGKVSQSGPGTVVLNAANSYSGGTVISAGTLGLGSDSALGSGTLTITGGGIRAVHAERTIWQETTFAGDFTLGRLTNFLGAVTLTKDVTITLDNPDTFAGPATSTIFGAVNGNHAITIASGDNAGSITFSGSKAYSGGTTLQSGLVRVDNVHSLGSGAINIVTGTLQALADISFTQVIAVSGSAGTFDTGGHASSMQTVSGPGGMRITGTGSLLLSGSNAYAGGTILESGRLSIGHNHALGTGLVTIKGGEIRAHGAPRTLANDFRLNGNFTLGRETTLAGNVDLGANVTITSANPDVSPSTISTISGAISGSHSLTFTTGSNPIGTIVLSGSNSYSGGTTLLSGTLRAQNNHAMGTGVVHVDGGVFLVADGSAIGNEVELGGGTYARTLSGNLANAVNATSDLGGVDTTATILAGSSGSTTLVTSFSASSTALNDEIRLSDVYSFHGTGSNVFVLELSFTATEPHSMLAWLNGNEWVNARDGNFDNNPAFAAQFNGSFESFQALHGADLSTYIGAWGVEVNGGITSVWTVLNHNSDFTIIPEPSAGLLAGFGAASLFLRRRRRSSPAL
jgi:fibronectin-binding autotransporter adhesin